MKSKRITALIMSLIMMLTLLSPMAAYADNSTVITVPAVSELPGATVDVALTIENNPGVLGATLTITYDEGLTLIGASNGEAFSPLVLTKPGKFTSPCNFIWDGQDIEAEDIKDGKILVLQFTIPEDAKAGTKYNVRASYEEDGIVDFNLKPVAADIVNGYVEVVDYTPGDLDGNSKVNATDVIMLRRHIAGGYDQTINEKAANVNNDGKTNATDVILMRRYIAGGYDVELVPESPKCAHVMTATAYKAPTCDEDGNIAYWHCSECDRYYSDEVGNSPVTAEKTVIKATGHDVVIDEAVEPTYDSEGRTQGSHCSVCDKVLVAQTIIPALKKEEYAITYHVSNNDTYLASLDINNPNPDTYAKEDGVVLEDLMVNGYNFVGWFTAQTGGTQVTEIAPGTTGNKTLYAHWEAVTYTVQYASTMVPQPDSTYTAARGLALPTPVLDKYSFIGWSDENGKIWDKIPVGSAGNMTLYANWSSDRNKAVAKTNLDDPIIVEDTENGRILFTYEIGEIKNVPLYTTLNLQCANGIITTVSQTTETRVEQDVAKNIAKTIANSTANTTSWTLSNDWSESTEVNEEYLEENKVEREEAEKLAKSQKGTYSLKSNIGETDGYTQNSGGSYKLSMNNAYSESNTIGSETSVGLSVDSKYSLETSASVGASIPGLGDASVGTKTGYEVGVGADFETSLNASTTGTSSWSSDEEFESSYSNTSTAEKSWSMESGYEVSNEESRESSVANTISKLVSQKYGYGKSYQEGGSRSEYADVQASQSESDEYSSSIAYHQGEYEIKTKTFESSGNTVGNYRMVMAGTMHVFAVVGYDIATNSYFVYTHNQMDDEAEEYLDYSWNHSFKDYETSIIPFEVPHFVNEYVNNRIAKTGGLEFDPDSGMITGYAPTGEQADEIVVIPSYWAVNNGDGTYTSHKVTGLKNGLFAGNTDIKAVQLGKFITEIPENAFDGCSSLKYVLSQNITKIGANAFRGCTSLASFAVPASVTEIGENAFEGVPEISAVVSTVGMAEIVAASGAEGIILNISEIPEDEAENMTFEIGEKTLFELRGGDRTYKGMSVKSDALTTIINGVTFSDNTRIPLELSSENVTLDRVTVDCSGYAMLLKADTTNLVINRNINLISSTENAVVAKNVNISKLNSDIAAKLNITGNMLVCGAVDNTNYLNFTNGELKYISEEEYENYLTAHKITFDANGGTVAVESKMASLNMPVGELPTPYRDYYTFDGWYTEAEGGELYTADTVMGSLTDITLYAHWVENDVSEWILASELPEDAEVVDTKYTYTLTSYTTSSSSSLSGWTKYDTTSVWSDYGSWSAWQDSYVGGSDSRQVQTQSVVASSNYKTQYVYYRWAVGQYTSGCWKNKTSQYPNYFEYYSDSTLGYDSANGGYKYWHTSSNYLIVWPASPSTRQVWVSDNYKTQYRYRDRHLIYTYYYTKDEAKESATRPTGDNISNVQEWVQYRAK